MLPQLPAIPLQSTSSSSDSAQNVNRLFPVGQNVSATVVAVSRDQIQPEVFKLKLEVNNRLIQMGVFQALPVGQKINVNRQSDGQIQITPQPTQTGNTANTQTTNTQNQPQQPAQTAGNTSARPENNLQLKLTQTSDSLKLPADTRVTAAVISSRPVYPATQQSSQPVIPSNAGANTTSQQPTGPQQQTIQTQPQTSGTTAQSAPATPAQTGPSIQSPSAPTPATAPVQNNLSQTSITPRNQAIPATPASITNNAPQSQPVTQQAAPSTIQNTNATTTQPSPTPQNQVTSQSIPPSPSPQDKAPQAAQQAQPNTTTPTRTGPPTHHLVSLALPDGSKVDVQSPRPIPQGAQLQLISNGNQNVQVLRIQEPPLTINSALDKPAIQEILRNTLPVQQPTATVFNQLAQATATETSQTSQIGSVVRSMLNLFGVRPGSSEAPSQIRQNVELGGLSTERQLSQGRSTSPLDMKAQLQQLQQLSEKLPTEQRERFDQIIKGLQSRVTSQQLNSLHQWRELPDGGFERVLQLDLPIKQGENWENLELRLSREGGTNATGEMVSVWRVRLHFDLEEQGGVDAEIRLTDGHEISTLFWCENKDTAVKLRE